MKPNKSFRSKDDGLKNPVLSYKKRRIALLACIEPIANTVNDHINSFAEYSSHNVEIHNLYDPHSIQVEKILEADIVIIHYTVSFLSDYRFPLYLRQILHTSSQLKILYIQDEYRIVDLIHSGLNYLKINVLFTCVPDSEIEKVYPSSKLPFLKKKINVLTGYVPENLLPFFEKRVPYHKRKIDVGYRGRKISALYGRLSQEKWMIVPKFLESIKKYKVKTDLSYLEEDRIYGDDWIKFLQSSKAMLGVESGASVFDFTGQIQTNVLNYEKDNPNADFETIEAKFFPGLDGRIYMNQISPRCFECTAVGTLMVLYEGKYSDVLKPWRHYIPLKKDHSNIKEVIEAIQNKELWEEITLRAYNEIALNPQYSYKKMIHDLDLVISEMEPLKFKKNTRTLKNKSSLGKKFLNIPLVAVTCIVVGVIISKDFKRQLLRSSPKNIIIKSANSNKIQKLISKFHWRKITNSSNYNFKKIISLSTYIFKSIKYLFIRIPLCLLKQIKNKFFVHPLNHIKNTFFTLYNSDHYLFNMGSSFRIMYLYVLMKKFHFSFGFLVEIFKIDFLTMNIVHVSHFNVFIKDRLLVVSFDEKNKFREPLLNRFYRLKSQLDKITQINFDFPMTTTALPENLRGNKSFFLKSLSTC